MEIMKIKRFCKQLINGENAASGFTVVSLIFIACAGLAIALLA
jgi:hypothetical protein